MRDKLLITLAVVGFAAALSPAWLFRKFGDALDSGQPVQYSGMATLTNLIFVLIVAALIGSILFFLVFYSHRMAHKVKNLEEEIAKLQSQSSANRVYPDGLTQREVEVLRLVAQGKSNQDIADDLHIALNTVARHLSNVFNKIGSQNRAEAAIYASNNELLD